MKNLKRKKFEEYAQAIKDLGYKVFVRKYDGDDYLNNYGWIVNDKDEIGYFQLDRFGIAITFSTRHKPCYGIGCGFGLDDEFEGWKTFDKEVVDRCFMHHPDWAKRCDIPKIHKWTATEFFAKYWNKENIIEF